MSGTVEIENAIRNLPATEARAIAEWLQEYLAHEAKGQFTEPVPSAFAKWRGCGQPPAGENVDDYLRIIRDGNGS